MATTSTERGRKFRAKVREDPIKYTEQQQKRRERDKATYELHKSSPEFQKANSERMRLYRWRKKNGISVSKSASETVELGSYKSTSTFSKGVKKVSSALPKDPVNQKVVIKHLYFQQYPEEKPKASRSLAEKELDKIVISFYNRDDVSQQLPSVKDRKLIRDSNGNKIYVQKRVMLLTISEAYQEFKKSNSTAGIGKTKFYLLKPSNIECTSEMKQIGCLCIKCENAKLMFAAVSPNMKENETIVRLDDLTEKLSCGAVLLQDLFEEDELEDEIKLTQWTQGIYQLRLTSEIKSLKWCVKTFSDKLQDYEKHNLLKTSQSSKFHNDIEESTQENAVMQVDFAENFKCVSQNEVQSAYFNQHGISVFTVVIWAGERKFSKVCVSDDTTHSKYCVVACLHEIITELKAVLPNLKSLKVYSDGCACQFKNRWTLSLILFAEDLFGVKMTWDFFAPGHGKGAVDGIGAIVKRCAHQRIMSGAVQIYSADDFVKCLKQFVGGIGSSLIPVEDIKQIHDALSPRWNKIKPIVGINKFFHFEKKSERIIEASETKSSTNRKAFAIMN